MAEVMIPPSPGGGADPVQQQVEALLGYRERQEIEFQELSDREFAEGGVSVLAAAPTAEAMAAAARVSPWAFELIVDYETGGRPFYERVLKSRPIWPRASSGITIGFGYDLGYVSAEEYRRDWATLIEALAPAQRAALEACVGFHSGKDPASRMQALLGNVEDISVGWDLAEAEFKAQTLPKYALLTERALPNTTSLNGDCFGTLVSLTFNRGASYSKAHNPAKDPRDRYREMRAIKAAMSAGRLDEIPSQIKSMIRIWEGTAVAEGMRRRRVDEADLFFSGLAGGAVVSTLDPLEASATASSAETLPPGAESTTGPSDEDFWVEVGEDDLAAAGFDEFPAGIAAAGATWAPDDVQPDYAHLGRALMPQGVPFTLTADDLALLARLNDFDVAALGDDTPVLFGLRGAGIVKDHTADDGIVLVDQRPDHSVPRCTLGVWDRRSGRVSVFTGSTVPNQNAVNLFRNKGTAGNLLATGLYNYVCGPHITSRTTPGCFLLRMPDMSKRVVVVRRSKNDLSYQRDDLVDRCAPGDNIHPAFFSQPTGFSSLGCQTITGTFKDGVHSGPWAGFRKAAGMTDVDGEPGKRFQYMLLTGAEARFASRLRLDGLANDPIATRRLRRLRAGSSGEAALHLQQRLDLPDPDGQMGPFTTESLHRFQANLPGAAGSDGILTPALDAVLDWRIFGTIGL